MRKLFLMAASAALFALQATATRADTFSWSYTGGGSNTGSGTLDAFQNLIVDPSGATYTVTSISGIANGQTITAPGLFDFLGSDQLVFPTSPRLVDSLGVGFQSATTAFTFYEDDGLFDPNTSPFFCGSIYCLAVGPLDLSSFTSFALRDLSITAGATPLPGALPLFASGLAGLGLFGLRRKRRAKAA